MRAIIIGFFCINIGFASVIEDLQSHCMSAEVWQEEDWPNEEYAKFIDRCMEYQRELQPFKKAKVSWGILKRGLGEFPENDEMILKGDLTTWENLQLFIPQHESESSLVECVDCTKLALGKRHLEHWIAKASASGNIAIVKERQKIVKELLANDVIFSLLEEKIEKLEESENLLFSFWLNDPLYNGLNQSYFHIFSEKINDALNASSWLLGSFAVWDHAKRIALCASAAYGTYVLCKFGLGYSVDPSQLSYLGSAGSLFPLMQNVFSEKVQSPFLWQGFYVCAAACSAKGVHENYTWAQDKIRIEQKLGEKLMHTANYMEALHEINDLLKTHFPHLSFSLTSALERLDEKKTDLADWLRRFRKGSFIRQFPGDILTACKCLHENKEEMEEALCSIGELDAYLSIARLYKEFETLPVHYNFVSFIEGASSPAILAVDFWNPFLDPFTAVANPISLGVGNSMRNVILTGPNEGGKSTFIKGLALSVILAQSLGIAPAREFSMTPFDYAATYLNITDEEGKSLFEVQAGRAKELLDALDLLEINKHAFLVFDELFNGTNAQMGQSLAYSFAKNLGARPNTMAIFPTHFPFLTTLGQKEGFDRYCVTADIDPLGDIEYLYKIVPGIWTHNIAVEILRREGYPEDLLDEAFSLYQKLLVRS